MTRRHFLGRCQWCDHFYEDHGDDDQCPGDYGGEPRCRPTWEPPSVDRLLELDGPRCEASPHDIHSERWRMLEIDAPSPDAATTG